ncbi:MAG: tetratricopeptide repeat protein [Methanoregula sp.]|uniref:tetratricopeptide repeat protein n=1 Tax=Methanoregula sp. TaxID=2052170 RepID=UPI003D0E788A
MKFGQITGILVIALFFCLVYPVAAANATRTDNATDFYNKGVTLLSSGDYGQAITFFDQALASNTSSIKVTGGLLYTYQGKSFAQIQMGMYNDSLLTLDQGLALYPNDSMLWNNKGYALFLLGKNQDALTAYDQAISLDRNDTNALINRGNVLSKMGRFQEAVDSFTAANQTDPGNSAAMAGLVKAQPAAAGSMHTTMIVVIVVLVVAAAGVIWYVKYHRPVEQKQPEKKEKGKKKNK